MINYSIFELEVGVQTLALLIYFGPKKTHDVSYLLA